MRCLWITRQDPRPADSGELIYSLGLLRSLAAQPGVEIAVLAHHVNGGGTGASSDHQGADPITWHLHGHIPDGRSKLKSVATLTPADSHRLGNPVQRKSLAGLLEQAWDWIIIDQAACAWAMEMIPATTQVLYLAHNHEASVRKQVASDRGSSLPMRLALKWDSWKYARMELALSRRANLISAITPRDAVIFRRDAPGVPVIVLPPGYAGEVPSGPARPIAPETPRRVVLAGAFEWLAKRRNLEAFLQAAAVPFQTAHIAFQVVGKADPDWFAGLARRYPWASFKANVPSIAPYLDGARIGLIPEALGGGFKLKALDYIFRGLPLASVDAALSGVPLDPRYEAIVARDPAGLAEAVAAKIDDLDFLSRAAAGALDACRSSFRWADRGVTLARALRDPAACHS